MHTIRIFLGTSLSEMQEEQKIVSDFFVNSVRPVFKLEGIDIEVFEYNNSSIDYTGEQLQSKIDRCLRQCDVFVFLFKSKAGKSAVHEFDMARTIKGKQQHSIFVFFFEVSKAETSKNLITFQNRLIDEGHFWYSCKDVTDLESQLILGLLQFKNQPLKINIPKKIEQKSNLDKDIDELRRRIKTILSDEKEASINRKDRIIRLYREACRLADLLNYNKEKQYDLLTEYTVSLIEYDLYDEAKAVCRRQISIAEGLFGLEHKETANSYNNLGSVYWQQGEYEKALECDLKALVIREKVLGENHPVTAESYNNIGSVYQKQGDYEEALYYHKKALKIRKEVLGYQHPDTATSYSNIGEVRNEQGSYKEALEFHKKALVIRKNNFDKEPAKVADTYNNIGLVYLGKGNYKKSLKYYEKALTIYKRDPDTKQLDIAESYNNIGKVYYFVGKFDNALKNDSIALKIREAVLGKEHPDSAESYNNIGKVYYAKDNYDEALKYYNKALQVRVKILGNEHTKTSDSYNNIGSVYWQQGEYQNALKFDEKALAIREKVLGEEHTDTAESYNNIGSVYHKQGDYVTALKFHFKALSIREKKLGTNHPDTATSYSNIGEVFYEQGRYDEALEYHRKALKVREEILGTEHAKTAETYNNMGLVYYNQGDLYWARQYYEKALERYEKVLGKTHSDTKNVEENLTNTDIVGKVEDALMNPNNSNSLEILKSGTKELLSCMNCTECSLWSVNYNSTQNNNIDDGFVSISLICRHTEPDVNYSFEKDVDYVRGPTSFCLNLLTQEKVSSKHFLRLNNESPESPNFISERFVKEHDLTDFIIIPISDLQSSDRQVMAFIELSFTKDKYVDDKWKGLSCNIQRVFYNAFNHCRAIKKQQLMEDFISIHGKCKNEAPDAMFKRFLNEILLKYCPAQGASLFIWNNYVNQYKLVATTGLNGDPNPENVFYFRGEGRTGRIGQTGEPIIFDNLTQEENGKHSEKLENNATTEMIIPITDPSSIDNVIGVFRLVNKTNKASEDKIIDFFNDDDKSVMMYASDYLALVIANYYKETDYIYYIDKLTHEIITPANAILKSAYQLYSHLGNEVFLSKYLSTYLKNIMDFAELQRWQASTNLFLSRSRKKQPFKVRYSIKPTLLYEVIQKGIDIAIPIAKKYNVPYEHIVIDPKSDTHLTVNIDKEAFITVFYNLFTNAIKYHDSNVQEQFSIDVSYSMGDYLVINVADNGIGIEEKDKNTIFEIGYRSKSAIRINASGYGIGLTVIKQIVEDFGGSIRLVNLRKPTVFQIKIPKDNLQYKLQ